MGNLNKMIRQVIFIGDMSIMTNKHRTKVMQRFLSLMNVALGR